MNHVRGPTHPWLNRARQARPLRLDACFVANHSSRWLRLASVPGLSML